MSISSIGRADVNARVCEEFIAFEIVYLDIVKNEFSNFFRVRESLNPTSIDYFLVEIPQMNIFDISVMRIECEIPNVLVAVSLRRAYALMKRIKSLKLTKYSQMIETQECYERSLHKNLSDRGFPEGSCVLFWLN